MRKVKKINFFNKKSHKLLFFSMLIFIILILISITTTLSELIRDDIKYEVVAFEYGEGTITKPYLIASRNDLEFLKEQVDSGVTYEDIYFQLAKDIDLAGEEWVPIGTRENSFRGIFDGAGHIISNMYIEVQLSSTSTVQSYGLFASLGGGTSKTHVKNINLENPIIEIANFSAYGSGGINIGSLAGTIYRNTEINNIIVNNLVMETTMLSNYSIRSNDIQVYIGGLVGVQTDTVTSTNDPGTNNYSHIRNSYVSLDVNLSHLQPRNKSYINQNALGGIVGAIRMQAVWPENCFVEGSLVSGSGSRSGFIGPIFGYLQGSASINTNTHNTMFTGTAMGSLNISSYFNNLTIQTRQFTRSQITDTVPNSTNYRISTSSSNVGYVQGINQGISLQDESMSYTDMLDKFNNDESITDIMWQYENNKFSFRHRLSALITETDKLNYEVVVTDPYNIGNYTYNWYKENEIQTNFTGSNFSIENNLDNLFSDHQITVLVYDGSYYAMDTVIAKKLSLYFEFEIDKTDNSILASLAGEALDYIDINDYTFKWYKEDITGYELEEVKTANPLILENASSLYDYRIEGVNSKYAQMSITGDITYSKRTVIFVSNSDGDDNNDGLTEKTAVETMAEAYSRFPVDNDINSNIVVLMGNYNTTDFLYSLSDRTKNNFSKNATVTGVYKRKDYDTRLYFYGQAPSNNNNGRYLYADTKLMYMTLTASTSSNGTGQTYLYCQGHSLTIGKEVYLSNYSSTSNTNGLIDNTTAPDFHIIGGFNNYNQSDLSNQSNNGTITIESGAFARIILGSRNTQVNQISHNFTGTSTDPFTMKLVIDIDKSTKNSNYDYDINLIVGGQTDGSMYGNSDITVYDGQIGRLLGGSIGYSRTVSGYPSNGYYGSTTLNIYGGEILELFGGSLGRLQSDVYFYGPININIHGGIINNNIYGVGAGGVTGYSELSSDNYKSYGQKYDTKVNINITGGILNGNLYGAGYGYSSYLTASQIAADGGALYGNANITISGGTINGDIYGAGRGYTGYADKNSLAQVYGNTSITVQGDATINGNIYGAGEGVSGNTETAKLTGNSTIIIDKSISNSIFGAGNASYQVGQTSVYIKNGTIGSDVYGGGNVGNVDGLANVYIEGGNLTNVYGGGRSSNTTNTNVVQTNGEVSTIFGGANETGNISTAKVELKGGVVNNVYGGNNLGGTVGLTDVLVNNIDVTGSIYGGGNHANTTTTNVKLLSSINKLTNVFAGGESANVTTTNIIINGIKAENIYAGSNKTGTISKTNIQMIKGEVDNLYGGNNLGGTTSYNSMTIKNGVIGTLYGGGNHAKSSNSKIIIDNGQLTNIFGGGNEAEVANTVIVVNDGIITNVYGGSNLIGDVLESKILFLGGKANNVYGGGNEAFVTTSNVDIENGTITNLYGAGNKVGVTTSNVILNGGNVTNIYGGANTSGDVSNSNITTKTDMIDIDSNNDLVQVNVTYDIKASESWQTTTYPQYVNLTFEIVNNSGYELSNWNATLIMPDSTIFANNSLTEIVENNGVYTFDEANRYWGNNVVGANSTYKITVDFLTMHDVSDFNVSYEFEANDGNFNSYYLTNVSEKTNISLEQDISLYIGSIYGGNNEGGKTFNPKITINGGTITNIYGGGNKAPVNKTDIIINSGDIVNVYGGGNKAPVNGNTLVNVNGSTIKENIYGGGNEGIVEGSTTLKIKDLIIAGNVYGGGNGITAVVLGNTLVNINGNTVVGNETSSIPHQGSVFGGGNAAATGVVTNNTQAIASTATVNIVSGTIYGNVYGGANTSVVHGKTYTNIGKNAVNNSDLVSGNIIIKGTVFGGGEANAKGSEEYDFSFISVTNGINVNINGEGHNQLLIGGSIFGSGNASSTSGHSSIMIENYGTIDNVNKNISIQRANSLVIKNSYIELIGATDRTNEYSDVLYTLSRIDELKLANNSNLFLRTGANLLKKVTSILIAGETETLETVNIETNSKILTQNVDNRLYMYEGKNLNIATNESSTSYGEMTGMAFFGLYTEGRDGKPAVGMYNNKYQFGELLTSSDEYLFTKGSYILGLHQTNHDTRKNGFYSNFSDNHYMKIDYVVPTPEDSNFYMWIIGEMVIEYNIDLVASKYSTLGAVELPLLEFSKGNTTFSILDFNFNGLKEDIVLTNSDNISRVSSSSKMADTVMSLVMKSNNTGWISKGETDFLSQTNNNILGTRTYTTENSTVVPSLLFYLYHSKNLETEGKMGTVTISLMAITKIDDLNNKTERLVINVNLSRALYNTNDYEGGITAGREYEMFVSQATNITAKSSISIYYSLFMESDKNIYQDGYHHSLVSSYVLPLNTQMTMIDYSGDEPVYYYHVIDQTDINNATEEFRLYGECSYDFSLFKEMGSVSSSNAYDDSEKNKSYYNSNGKYLSEEFIFILDFKNTNITEDLFNQKLLMELRDSDDQTIINVLGIEQEQLIYSIFVDNDAIIELDTKLDTNIIYKGQVPTLTVEADFIQNLNGSNKIYDTNYFDDKLGLKLTVYDSNNNQVTSATLLGFYFEIDGTNYYPSMDGTTRINISEKVANVLSRIKLHTENTNIPTGTYTIKIESFASADGIYYGLESSDTNTIEFVFVNDEYGLKVDIEDNDVIIDNEKGFTQDNNSEINMTINYNSILSNPNIRVELYRREYEEIYQNDYILVDIKNYFVDDLDSTNNEKEYILINSPDNVNQITMYLKNSLITGTYKLKYKLYDNDVYIGSVEKYIIIQ